MDKEETIWEELDRFIGSIKDEIRDDNPSSVSIDFWLFKIERRVNVLKEYIDGNKKSQERDHPLPQADKAGDGECG